MNQNSKLIRDLVSKQSEQKSFFLRTNGCIRRKLDAQHTLDFLFRNGYKQADDPKNADLLIFISCAADDGSEAAARDEILDLERSRKPTGKLLVGGCLPKINPEFIRSIEGLVGIFEPIHMEQLDNLVPEVEVPFMMIPEPNHISEDIFMSKGLRTRSKYLSEKNNSATIYDEASDRNHVVDPASIYESFKKSSDILRVAQGCRSECAYCCIRFATGRLVSRPLDKRFCQ